ncbi:MAG: iron ABC transporter permease [Rhodococcus sp. (in: high G+C Gram-positive bacteria)]|uniref:FecCD family ABC transporter permease n=1 Tax=Rhodococcus sp. TaxID=1831 RepID=UPI003BB4D194
MTNLAVRDGHLRSSVALVLVAGLAGGILVALMLGRYPLTIEEVVGSLSAAMNGGTFGEPVDSVVFGLRMPRILLAALAGAGLACAGAAFQSLFGNPLATPDTLGVTSGASIGAVVALLLNMSLIGMQLLALVAGVVTVVLTTMISKTKQGTGIVMLILAGVMVGALANAVISILKYTADPNDKLPQITYWLMGSLAGASFDSLLIGAPLILGGIAIIYLLRWRLNVLALGEDESRAAGMNVRRIRAVIIGAATLITASVVSMCGQVGWIGLLIPHCARMICGNNNRFIVPVGALLGAIFLVAIDTVARSVAASEIPISVVTSVLGAPFFIYLLRRTGGGWQ